MFTIPAAARSSSVHEWLAGRVAAFTDRPVHLIDPAVPLAELGFDSASAVALCGEIEDHWLVEADPTVVFDYPTITDLAAYITTELQLAA